MNLTFHQTRDAIMRFLAFTIAMITLPLSTYWVCVYKIPALGGSTTLGGALAAVVANVILVSYLGIIMLEDSQERKAEADEKDEKKTQ